MDFIVKLVCLVWLRGKLRYRWSRFFRKLECKFFKKEDLVLEGDILDCLREIVMRMRYKRDSWWMLFDVISLPGVIWARKYGDCDDYAVLSGEVIRRKGGGIVRLLTVVVKPFWRSHTVCLWFDGVWKVIDNGNLVKKDFIDVESVVKWLCKEKGYEKVYCYDLVDLDLNLLKFKWM